MHQILKEVSETERNSPIRKPFLFYILACDYIRQQCCAYNTYYDMVPKSSWGSTPDDEKQWHRDNNCDEVMGGTSLSNCPYVCEGNC